MFNGSGFMSNLPRQCHVTAGGNTREIKSNNWNDFSNRLRIIGHRPTRTHTDNLFEEKKASVYFCVGLWLI